MSEAKVQGREQIFSGRVVDLAIERVELPNGERAELELIRHPGAAAVVPLTARGEVLLVRQYRHAIGDWLLEVPAGKLDPGEDPEDCARREVEEETGWRPGCLEPLGWIWSSPGFTDERIWLFEASALVRGEQALEADEVLSVVRLPLAEAVAQAGDGRIVDSKSVCALLRAHHRRAAGRAGSPPQPLGS